MRSPYRNKLLFLGIIWLVILSIAPAVCIDDEPVAMIYHFEGSAWIEDEDAYRREAYLASDIYANETLFVEHGQATLLMLVTGEKTRITAGTKVKVNSDGLLPLEGPAIKKAGREPDLEISADLSALARAIGNAGAVRDFGTKTPVFPQGDESVSTSERDQSDMDFFDSSGPVPDEGISSDDASITSGEDDGTGLEEADLTLKEEKSKDKSLLKKIKDVFFFWKKEGQSPQKPSLQRPPSGAPSGPGRPTGTSSTLGGGEPGQSMSSPAPAPMPMEDRESMKPGPDLSQVIGLDKVTPKKVSPRQDLREDIRRREATPKVWVFNSFFDRSLLVIAYENIEGARYYDFMIQGDSVTKKDTSPSHYVELDKEAWGLEEGHEYQLTVTARDTEGEVIASETLVIMIPDSKILNQLDEKIYRREPLIRGIILEKLEKYREAVYLYKTMVMLEPAMGPALEKRIERLKKKLQ